MSSSHVYWIFHLLMLIIIFCDLEMHAESSKKLLHSTCGDGFRLTSVNTVQQKAYSSQRKLLVHAVDNVLSDVSSSPKVENFIVLESKYFESSYCFSGCMGKKKCLELSAFA
ncbi:hypothetical protein CRYUN_Cryun40dG0006800 [Craigia yunnanensis]